MPTVAPRFSVYVRVLPTWEEISTERFGISIDFKQRKDKKQEIDHEIRERRQELYAQEKLDRSYWNELSQEEREVLRSRRREIRDSLRNSVYGKLGIILDKASLDRFGSSEGSQTEESDEAAPVDGTEDPDAAPSPAIGRLVTGGAQIPTSLLSPASIPPKWKRIDLKLPSFSWSAALYVSHLKSPCVDTTIVHARHWIAVTKLFWLAFIRN